MGVETGQEFNSSILSQSFEVFDDNYTDSGLKEQPVYTTQKYSMPHISLGCTFLCQCFTFLVQTHFFQNLSSYSANS